MVFYKEISVTGGAGWSTSEDFGAIATRVRVDVMSTVGADKVEISFDKGTTIHGALGPLGDRPMTDEWISVSHMSQISIRCDSDATVRVRATQ